MQIEDLERVTDFTCNRQSLGFIMYIAVESQLSKQYAKKIR